MGIFHELVSNNCLQTVLRWVTEVVSPCSTLDELTTVQSEKLLNRGSLPSRNFGNPTNIDFVWYSVVSPGGSRTNSDRRANHL